MKQIASLLLCFLIFGCKKTVETVKPVSLLGKFKSISIDLGTEQRRTISFSYDAKGVLNKVETNDALNKTTETLTFVRDSAQRIVSYGSTQDKIASKFTVQRQDNLISQIANEGLDRIAKKFRYNTAKQVIVYSKTNYANNNPSFSGTAQYNWLNGNPTEIKNSLQKGEYEEENWTYESRENPIAKFYAEAIGFPQEEPLFMSQHLPATRQLLYADDKYKFGPRFDINQVLKIIDVSKYDGSKWVVIGTYTIAYY